MPATHGPTAINPARSSDPAVPRGSYTVKGNLAPGAIVNGDTYIEIIPIAGASRVRMRWLSTGAGTLSFAFLRPDGSTAYTGRNPANVAVVGGTECYMEIDPHFGEAYLQITFLASAGGSITYCDISEV